MGCVCHSTYSLPVRLCEQLLHQPRTAAVPWGGMFEARAQGQAVRIGPEVVGALQVLQQVRVIWPHNLQHMQVSMGFR